MSPAPTITGSSDGGGGEVTVMVELPETPPAVARIVAAPAATPVTRPLVETVATAAFDVDQVKLLAALAGDAVAVSCTLPFTATVADDGETVTFLTPGPPFASDGPVGATGS
jgi:hypothetical protein